MNPICRAPQGLKPAFLLAPGGTAEAVPFPFVLKPGHAVSLQRITIFSAPALESKGCSGVFRNPYILIAPIETRPRASARQT